MCSSTCFEKRSYKTDPVVINDDSCSWVCCWTGNSCDFINTTQLHYLYKPFWFCVASQMLEFFACCLGVQVALVLLFCAESIVVGKCRKIRICWKWFAVHRYQIIPKIFSSSLVCASLDNHTNILRNMTLARILNTSHPPFNFQYCLEISSAVLFVR